ncbi:hypothetical protein H2198_003096 [Neophaeococcomyces mojaviensis]|uniref:Uncharacterized protein n=1 Tax=Neophaeococcomyces mojaviensis TaxID=3383035 RepID=A0ACC3ACI6_9EURO|nr:hypothetical protein H2198_003096 [Knufia sp. JES_112]
MFRPNPSKTLDHGINPRDLFVRQTAEACPTGLKTCGTGCIETSYICCPDGSGGCPATDVCAVGANGLYGCCPIGVTCTGNGAIQTTAISIVTASTSTVSMVTTLYTTATPSSLESVSHVPTTTSTTKPSPTSAAESDLGHHGLSTKAIIGIAVGAAALVLILIVGLVHLIRKHRHRNPHWSYNPNPLPVRPATAEQRWGPAELHNDYRESQQTMLRYQDSDSQAGLDMLANGSPGRLEAFTDGNRHELGTHR